MIQPNCVIKIRDKVAPYWHIALITIVGVCCYLNTFEGPFVFDDIRIILEYPAIKDVSQITLSTRIVGYLSFALNYKLHGFSVFGYHFINLFIHIVNGILIFYLAGLICTPQNKPGTINNHKDKYVQIMAALLFISHPVQTQAVTYIVQRLASLATSFTLFAVIFYILSHRSPSRSRARSFYLLSLTTTILAMFTKEFTIVIPLILGVWEILFNTEKKRKKCLKLIPFFCSAALIPIITFKTKLSSLFNFNLSEISTTLSKATSASEATITATEYFFTQCRVLLTYFRLFFWPSNQNLDYDFPIYKTFWTWEVFLPFTLVSALILTSIGVVQWSKKNTRKTRHRICFFVFLLWSFFISLLTESSVLPLADVIYEHRLYFPSVWFFILSASMLKQARDASLPVGQLRNATGVAIGLILITSLSCATWTRNQVWQSNEILWRDVVSKSPHKVRPRQNLAKELNEQGLYAEALEVMSSISIKNTSKKVAFLSHWTLGDSYLGLADTHNAIKEMLLALTIYPKDTEALSNLGVLYSNIGDYSRAESTFKAALEISPNDASIYFNLGEMYWQRGESPLAEQFYKKAISINANYEEALYNLGTIYNLKGKYGLAEQLFLAAITANPGFVSAYNNLTVSLANQGRTLEAIAWCQKALLINPEDQTANRNLILLSQ